MRRRNIPVAMEPKTPNKPNDHLVGQHFEDFMSEQTNVSKHVYPETSLQAAINGNNLWEQEEFNNREAYGEEVAKRRDWLEHDAPGGSNWNPKKEVI